MNRLRARRLTHKEEYDRVFAYGKRIFGNTVRIVYRAADQPALGLAVSRAYGNAVKRNRFKRRARAAFRHALDRLPACQIICMPRHGVGEVSYHEIYQLLQNLSHRNP